MLDTASLVEQIVTVELSVGHETPPVLRAMLRDIQFAVLDLQRERLEMLHELEHLRHRAEKPTRTSLLNSLRDALAGSVPADAAKGKG
ncbi:MAG TPA: hypothetical protein VMD92_15960 [Acidobacteriaceae bacterium]|jgi:hypothetical protein|nr:hypothetical protein [Acidobacteriaceae bacterium]